MADPIIGYDYYMDIHMGLCRGPVDELVEVKVGDRSAWPIAYEEQTSGGAVTTFTPFFEPLTTYTPPTFSTVPPPPPVTVSTDQVNINAPNIFGGQDSEGGVVGKLDVMMGEASQGVNPRLSALVGGSLVSAFRGVCTLFFSGLIAHLNPYPKPWKFRVRRYAKGWDNDTCWNPSRVLIPQSRRLSSSEEAARQNTVTATFQKTVVMASVDGINFTANVTLEGTSPAITHLRVRAINAYTSGFTQAILRPGEHFTYAAGVISFIGTEAQVGIGTVIFTAGLLVTVYFTTTITTTTPITGVDPGGVVLIRSMNPAHIVYECCTNRDWGRGLPSSRLDSTSFAYAADILFSEEFGLCLKWTRENTIEEFVKQVLDHIGAVLYTSRTTGLLTLKMLRGDYTLASLPIFTTSTGILEVSEDSTSLTKNLTNEIVVKYVDSLTGNDGEQRVQNLAGVQSAGGIISKTVDYPGIPTADLASRVGLRDLRVHSYPLRRFTFKMDRRAWQLEPGSVFRYQDPARGIADMVMRVGKVKDTAASVIEIVAVQDVFALSSATFVEPGVLTAPVNNPQPVASAFTVLREASYYDLLSRLTEAERASLTGDETFVYLMGAQPTLLSPNYDVYTGDPTTGLSVKGQGIWTPLGELNGAIDALTNSGTVDAITSLAGIVPTDLMMIDNEVMQVITFNSTTGAIQFSRGCLDTIPATHADNAQVWFFSKGVGSDTTRYAENLTLAGRVLTRTSAGVLPIASATQVSYTTVGRHSRPYPPGLVKVNTVDYRTPPATVYPNFIVSWAHRNKVTQADQIRNQQSTSVTPPVGVTYTIRIYRRSDNALLTTITGLTGTSWQCNDTVWITIGRTAQINVRLWSVEAGVESWQNYTIPLDVSEDGFGMNFGNQFSNAV